MGPQAAGGGYSTDSFGWNLGPGNIYSDPLAVYGVVRHQPVVIESKSTEVKLMDTPVLPKPREGMGANLKFRLPANAKLYVDGQLTLISGTERAFTTPALLSGQKFYYDVKAELMVDGKMVVEEKRVLVEAGSTLVESFSVLFAAIEGKSAPVAGK